MFNVYHDTNFCNRQNIETIDVKNTKLWNSPLRHEFCSMKGPTVSEAVKLRPVAEEPHEIKKHTTGDIKQRFQKITFRSSATKNAKQNMTKADPKCCFFVKVNTRVHSEMIKVRVESTTIYSWMFLWVSSRTSTLSDSKNGLVITPDFQGSAYIDTILVTKMWMSQVLLMHIELKGWISPPGPSLTHPSFMEKLRMKPKEDV